MSKDDFGKLVKKSVMALPKHIQEKMDNVVIVVEEKPSQYELRSVGTRIENSLLGLYQGVPKTVWGREYGMRLPDKITIFQEPIESFVRSPAEISELVKIVVWHEIAHHFGFSEKKVRGIESKWKKYPRINLI